MKFIIRKVGTSWFLTIGKKGRKQLVEWSTTATKATRFDDYGAAALRAEKLGLSAHEIMVEAVPS